VLGLSRPVWIDRQSKQKSLDAVNHFRETLIHGIPLVVYPEGTTSPGCSGILPFKSTPFGAVATSEHKFEILPVLTIYDIPAEVAWYGDMELLPHVWHILSFRHINVTLHVLPPVIPENDDRKLIAKSLHDIMEREYWKTVKNKKISETTEAVQHYEEQRT
jgi:1-acyl-sn-glycerol-3-phosphate acyltransferase